ncbi:DsrE/DsrF/DrsH-like family protein [Candidatus Bathyarchaeota archaeon]|nr:DsrE/DsrF/DrsH-like family protein [Candidatus Bathyarchaeota archaeon]MBS7630156.1 DsrE/DsrF/DrsH-like family protein [Candidatus Bathyarchaeota archaeon]
MTNKKMALIVYSGTIDKLLSVLILSSAAISMDFEVHMYFTFWGLTLLKKGEMDKSGLPSDYKHLENQLKEKLKQMKYPAPYEMLRRLKESGKLKIYACTPTMEMFGITKNDLIPEVDTFAGAATFLDVAEDSKISMMI